MANYIDADRLRAEIKHLKIDVYDEAHQFDIGARSSLTFLESFIDSLQQEQPEGLHFTPLNRLIQKIPSKDWNDTVNNYAKKLRDCLITEGYRKDAEVLQGYISYMNGNNVPMATMDEQEQPEVDLEKEMEKFGERWPYPVSFDGYDKEWVDELTEECAKHFYELGLNARKEDK